jgi:hypothetical protein
MIGLFLGERAKEAPGTRSDKEQLAGLICLA